MAVKGILKKGEYYDSVTLMLVQKDALNIPGVEDAAVVMGTLQNKSILDNSGMLIDEFKNANDSDLLIVVKGKDDEILTKALVEIEKLLKKSRSKSEESQDYVPKSLDGALKLMRDANLVLISVAGKYAGDEAIKALSKDLHVMIFSDNVPKEKALLAKKIGYEKGLLVMGPDCGTAIINGAPLGFANAVERGDIGIVSAAGTGLQEVSSIISNAHGGISQAIGTGGIDMKEYYGGLSFLTGLKALIEDDETKVIVLISKPPHESILQKLKEVLKNNKKPVVGCFLGASKELVESLGVYPVSTLEDAALLAVSLSKGTSFDTFKKEIEEREELIKKEAYELAKQLKPGQKYFRGLFQGGTLAYETELILTNMIGEVYSNVPLKPEFKLKDSWKSEKHTIVDLGEDEFTVGRPHPQIDFQLRNKRILEEAKDKEVAIIYLDVVIGYGTNMHPIEDLVPVIEEVKKISDALVIVNVTGTDKDPQNKRALISALKNASAHVYERNAYSSKVAGYVIKEIGG
ncbi:acyl-CoA synthetase FdrA [Caldisericum exile]|uniref:acyl-CoA synthetase FdrA n=1 Tax=Caldisericum exile TaxID=693075 RepID=UPI003C740F6B